MKCKELIRFADLYFTMSHLSKRVLSLAESQTIAMARKSRELAAQGIDIISLSLGEPDFPTPDPIKLAAKKAIDDNYSYYTHVSGYLEMRQAICRKFKRDNGLDFTPEQIVVSTGAKQSIANAVLCLIDEGDEVIVPSPYWVSYLEILKVAEGKAVVVPTQMDNDFKLTAAEFEKAITPKTRLLIFSSPCNPTGSVYTKAELKALVDVLEKHPNIYVISDEIYEHINFVGKHEAMAQFDSVRDRIITINGVSKGFAMTGWRGGILAAAKDIAIACDKMQGQFTSATCSITQKAIHAAMDLPLETTHDMRDAFKKRRDLVYERLRKMPGLKVNLPQGAFYFFPDVTSFFGKKHGQFTIQSGTDLCNFLLEEAYLALVPGAAFGDDRFIRLSYATSEEKLIKAMDRLESALQKLQ